MKIISLNAEQQQQVKVLQDAFTRAQKAHVVAYQEMLAYLKPIAGALDEQGRKSKISVADDLQHIVVT